MGLLKEKEEKVVLFGKKFLSHLKIGQKAIIINIHDTLETKTLLMGMGILPGDEIEVTSKSLFGSPISFRHSDSNFFALRKNQARLIEIE